MKICLECAEGGHLDELMSVLDAFLGHDIFFVTTKAETTKHLGKIGNVYFVRKQYDFNYHFFIFVIELYYFTKLLFLCSLILTKEKPQVIVSTGGGSTIPLCYWGKLMRIKIVYINSLARVNDLSGTGKLIYPIADLFLVQWEPLAKKFKKANYWGKVI